MRNYAPPRCSASPGLGWVAQHKHLRALQLRLVKGEGSSRSYGQPFRSLGTFAFTLGSALEPPGDPRYLASQVR
jgi:hypothetical protein